MGAVGRLVTVSAVGGVLAAALVLPAVGATGILTRNAALKFDSLSTQTFGQLPQRSEILDRNGHLLAYVYNVDQPYYYGPGDVKSLNVSGIDRVPVSYSQIAPVMVDAIVAIEDSRYWEHGAIDIKGTFRALVNNLQHRAVQGGSTIAQQYVKNLLILSAPDPQQAQAASTDTITRKLKELRLAIAIEHQQSKEQILTGYLNDAYFGNLAYGVEVAAETYFHTTAAKLTLQQAALLAGLVENPSADDPIANPSTALERRNTVLARMAQLGVITQAKAQVTEKLTLGLHVAVPQNGCTSQSASYAAFYCDYAEQVILRDSTLGKTPADRANLLATGGLKIYTTLDPKDQQAADNAVSYIAPPHDRAVNPARNAIAEAIVQPGTGQIRAIAEDRTYGGRTSRGETTVDYAVGPQYGGGEGVQIGSTGKVFTMVAALEQNIPFGFSMHVNGTAVVNGFTNCAGAPAGQGPAPNYTPGQWSLTNDQGELGSGSYTLYTGTTASINTFFAPLEKQVGLCNTVKTADTMGLTWPDGVSMLKSDPYLTWLDSQQSGHHVTRHSADNDPSFTLGADNVTPLSVAAADATLAARGVSCAPIAIDKIVKGNGASLPVPSAGCHQALSATVADAANYILAGDLLPGGTAGPPNNDRSIGRPAASKTGTSDQYTAAFFAGYTPDLASAVWMGNPAGAFQYPMNTAASSCYRDFCPGLGYMYGSMGPGRTWQITFQNANLASPALNFVPVPRNSVYYRMGDGHSVQQPRQTGGNRNGNGGGGNGGRGINPPNCPNFPFCF
jgi:membrane peptidoglycan carboxypeptidase